MRIRADVIGKKILVLVLPLLFISCSKKDQNSPSNQTAFETFSLFPGQDKTSFQSSTHQILIRVPDNIHSGTALVANFSLSSGASASVNGQQQLTGSTTNNFEGPVSYTVTAADQYTRQIWKVQAANNDYSVPWGLGNFIHQSVSNDVDYNWYIDQGTSGQYYLVNCGPASVTMAIHWADSSFSKTAVDARQTYNPSGGWWYTNDMDAYLNLYNITHAIISLSADADSSRDLLIRQLDHHQIVILCLDMNYIRSSEEEDFHVDKFYPTTSGWGHFIVLKGYKRVDGNVFFETYDPYSLGLVNQDKNLKGLNRFYRYNDLAAACQPWWNFAFIIAKKGEQLDIETAKRKLDPSTVPVAHNF